MPFKDKMTARENKELSQKRSQMTEQEGRSSS